MNKLTFLIYLLVIVNLSYCDDPVPKVDTKFDCKAVPTKRTAKPDPECTHQKPARCPSIDGIAEVQCAARYGECTVSSGCGKAGQGTRCITGECVSHVAFCPYDDKHKKAYNAICTSNNLGDLYDNTERCRDGICRQKGSCVCQNYSGCKFGQFQCPDGRCTQTAMSCLGFSNCRGRSPFQCKGGYCVADTEYCMDNITVGSFNDHKVNYLPPSAGKKIKEDIDQITIRNVLTNRVSLIQRQNEEIFQPIAISPFYDMVKTKECLTNLKDAQEKKKERRLRKNTERILSGQDKETEKAWKDETQEVADPRGVRIDKLWKKVNDCYQRKVLDKKSELLISYVSTEKVKKTKNKLGSKEAAMMESIDNIYIQDGKLSNELSFQSTIIQVTTKGRFNDNDNFKYPPVLQFTVNGMVDSDVNRALGQKHFNAHYCLARRDEDSEQWKCVNRNTVSYKPNIQIHAANSLDKDTKSVQFSTAFAEYKIPFPGIFVVIHKPQQKSIHAKGLFGTTGPFTVMVGLLFTVFVFVGIIIWFIVFLGEDKKSDNKANIAQFRYNQFITAHPSYKGQTHVEKLENPVIFFNNPLKGMDDAAIEEFVTANKELEEIEIEVDAQFKTMNNEVCKAKHKRFMRDQLQLEAGQSPVGSLKDIPGSRIATKVFNDDE